ncbi:MAG: protein-signal peptide and transmembrane prediction [Solibacterales bacterium]|nr:protein-signal peptide and transmembrane prediction [Bryobacterales bacterium]
MTRRQIILSIPGMVLLEQSAKTATVHRNRSKRPGKLALNARSRVERPPSSGHTKVIESTLNFNVSQTAIIVCDMWDDHWCKSSARRVTEMAPVMNQVISAARQLGVMVIHAPSGTIDYYKDTPQYRRMAEAPHVDPPTPIKNWCHLEPDKEKRLPIDDTDGGCDDTEPRTAHRVWRRQHPAIEIKHYDGISDQGSQVYNFCYSEGITNLAIMGVHTNMCILGRSFGIRQMVRLGMKVVLVRDLTDSMYDPRDEPKVTHQQGTDLVIEHIERYWCPSVLSRDLITLGQARELTRL